MYPSHLFGQYKNIDEATFNPGPKPEVLASVAVAHEDQGYGHEIECALIGQKLEYNKQTTTCSIIIFLFLSNESALDFVSVTLVLVRNCD